MGDAEKVKAVQRIAREFHQNYERLAPLLGYKTRKASAVKWSELPEKNKLLMMETVDALLEKDIISIGPKIKDGPRRRSAKSSK